MKKIAISQSNYIPWKGYFDLINSVDEFVIYDDMQYTRRDWRNRNLIKTPNGVKWLSIPVEVKGRFTQAIKEVKVVNMQWKREHLESLRHNYSKALYFRDYFAWFEELLMGTTSVYLSEINAKILKEINALLGIVTKISYSWDYELFGDKTQKLINICKQTGASEYISGPSAKNYIDENLFKESNIKLSWFDYDNYPQYTQLYPPFIHNVSVLDLLFNTGKNASFYLKSFNSPNYAGGGAFLLLYSFFLSFYYLLFFVFFLVWNRKFCFGGGL
ncbi:WbqC family protein [Helicobacter winghamensis]|uniref:WbqC family protein n=1 Tax=Helicobacter winghamensis TaxID=157268 RepID=UPI0001A28504|nr:WbqC family protein [Helicobacter winghamensis]EEO25469.1 WbqC-like protein [Helicobacter winghamensis ATCC BAA-430]